MLKFIRFWFKAVLLVTGAISLFRCSSGYKQKNGKTFYNGEELADKNLTVLNDVFAKDSASAYYRGGGIDGADVATFKALDKNYAKDKDRVYYCEEHREGQNYFTTKKSTIKIVREADAATFDTLSSGYGKDKSLAFFEGDPFSVKDIVSFNVISLYFSRDKILAYFRGKQVASSDGNSFELINNHYAKDNNHIYYYGYPSDAKNDIYLIPCNRNTFTELEYPYSSDDKSVFYENLLISGSTPDGFVTLGAGFSKDRQSVFFETKKINGADASSFKLMVQDEMNTQEFYFAGDKSSLYFREKKIATADIPSFKILGLGYAVDRDHVYYRHSIIKTADPETFEVYTHGYGEADAKDSKHEYMEGKQTTTLNNNQDDQ